MQADLPLVSLVNRVVDPGSVGPKTFARPQCRTEAAAGCVQAMEKSGLVASDGEDHLPDLVDARSFRSRRRKR